MADSKVSALTEITTFDGDETFYVVDDDDGTPVSRRMTVENLATGLGGRSELAAALSPAWTTYTPTWGASGTQPAIGNGTIGGAWTAIGKTLHLRIALQMGTTTTYGTGGWTLSLPAGKTTVNAGISQTGHILTYDSSANAVSLGSISSGINSTTLSLFTSSANMTGTAPWTWATGDQVIIQATLEIQ